MLGGRFVFGQPAGQIDQDIHPAKLFERLLDHAIDLSLVGQVGGNREHFGVQGLDLVGARVEFLGPPRHQHEPGALLGKSLRHGLAVLSIAADAGNDRNFSLQFHRCCLLSA